MAEEQNNNLIITETVDQEPEEPVLNSAEQKGIQQTETSEETAQNLVIEEPEKKEAIEEPEKKEAIEEPEKKEAIEEPEKKEAIEEPEKKEVIEEPENKEVLKEAEKDEAPVEDAQKNLGELSKDILPVDQVLVKTDGFGKFETIDSLHEGNAEAQQRDDSKPSDMPADDTADNKADSDAVQDSNFVQNNTEDEPAEPKPDPMEGMGEEPEPYVEPEISDLYYDYTDRLEGIENNRYFRYLYEMVRAGDNRFEQSNQILHKVVDETWLTTIEDSLDALNRIIDNPRKFIKTEEEIVPVGLAKKITADSVKHLSHHTEFIVSEPGEPVQPTKILNSTLEETYDLYENRFIYHLIQRLVRFIDKRTDVIFWSTGDEKRNKLVYESQVDDAYEQISYKIEMTIKNLQSYAENDADNMEVFARIDRLRRLVMSIRASSFCSIMSGCTMVRSPIQRTNLMIKDPDYRTCYKLWHFLEDYDDVGYHIEVLEDAMAFDDDYVSQMYTGLVNNYTVFKSLMEEDERVISDELIKKKELAFQNSEIVPKFVKQIQEVQVDNRDLPDVEIRRVFVEEVTQAQLDAEAHAEECEKAMQEAQAAQAEAEHQALIAEHEKEEAVSAAKEAGKRMEEAEERARISRDRASQAESERRAAEQRCKEEITQAKADADLLVLKAEDDARAYKEKADQDAQESIENYRAETEEKVKAFVDETNEQLRQAQEESSELQKEKDQALEKAEKARKARDTAEENARIRAEECAAALEEKEFALRNLEKLEKKVAVSQRMKESAENRALQKVYSLQSSIQKAKESAEEEKALRKQKEQQIEELREANKELEKELKKQKADYEAQLAELKASRGIAKWFKK